MHNEVNYENNDIDVLIHYGRALVYEDYEFA